MWKDAEYNIEANPDDSLLVGQHSRLRKLAEDTETRTEKL